MKRVLYAEENIDTRQAVTVLLSNAGYEVEAVSSGHECYMKLKKKEYDLVLLDLLPPEMYGYDIFERLRGVSKCNYAFHSHVPLSPGVLRLFRKVGICDHITKPFNKTDLLTRIGKVFS